VSARPPGYPPPPARAARAARHRQRHRQETTSILVAALPSSLTWARKRVVVRDQKNRIRKGLLDLNYGGRALDYVVVLLFGGGLVGAIVLAIVRLAQGVDPLHDLGPGVGFGMTAGLGLWLVATMWAVVVSRDPKELREPRRLRLPRRPPKGRRRR
jgi:hypothetical protein